MEDRLRWFEDNANLNLDWLGECRSKFLVDMSVEDEKLAWIAPTSAREQCGLFWFLHQTQVTPNKIVVADYPVKNAWRGEPPKGLGEVGPDGMAELLDDAPRPEWDISRFPIDKWRSLMDDGAVVRVVERGVLRSARSDHYDEWLLRWCPSHWTKWYRVVGDAMCHANQPISDLFLRWRLAHLIETGAIEVTGELPDWDKPTTMDPARIRRAN